MSTPSETIRTATSHGSPPRANASITLEAPGSSEVATRACVPKRVCSSDAMPRACSWSMAITRPPASGCSWRISRSRSFAARSTLGSQSPSSDNAVRRRWLARAAPRGSSNVAACSDPSGADHSMWPFVRGKYTGRTTRPSASASP